MPFRATFVTGDARMSDIGPNRPFSTKQLPWYLWTSKPMYMRPDGHGDGSNTLDNYLWLRYHFILICICLGGVLLTWPILLPVNAMECVATVNSFPLDCLSIDAVTNQSRYWAHAGAACLFFAFVLILIAREIEFSDLLRQAYLTTPWSASRLSSRTVLFTNVPSEHCNAQALQELLPDVRTIWPIFRANELQRAVDQRDGTIIAIEKEHINAMMKASSRNSLMQFKGQIQDGWRGPLLDRATFCYLSDQLHKDLTEACTLQTRTVSERGARSESICCEFYTIQAAHRAYCKSLRSTRIKALQIGMTPDMMLWSNLAKPFFRRIIDTATGWIGLVLLMIMWNVAPSLISMLIGTAFDGQGQFAPFDYLSPISQEVISNLVPTIIITVAAGVPNWVILQLVLRFSHTTVAATLVAQDWSLAFSLFYNFFVIIIGFNIIPALESLVFDPYTFPHILTTNLLGAADFYIYFFASSGWLWAASQFINIHRQAWRLFCRSIAPPLPRYMYWQFMVRPGSHWGAWYAGITTFAVVALIYAVISPLVLGFALLAFTLLYLAMKADSAFMVGDQFDTSGAAYSRSLWQLAASVHIAELLTLVVLYDVGGDVRGPLMLVAGFTVMSILAHVLYSKWCDAWTLSDKLSRATAYDLQQSLAYRDALEASERPLRRVLRHMFRPSLENIMAILHTQVLVAAAEPHREYDGFERTQAYLHPAISSTRPIMWLPRDKYGLSEAAIRRLRRAVGEHLEATDEGATMDETGSVAWTTADEAPLSEKRIFY